GHHAVLARVLEHLSLLRRRVYLRHARLRCALRLLRPLRRHRGRARGWPASPARDACRPRPPTHAALRDPVLPRCSADAFRANRREHCLPLLAREATSLSTRHLNLAPLPVASGLSGVSALVADGQMVAISSYRINLGCVHDLDALALKIDVIDG